MKKIIGPIAIVGIALVTLTLAGCNKAALEETETTTTTVTTQTTNVVAKEFTMTSFYEMSGDQPKPQYSLTGITVKK